MGLHTRILVLAIVIAIGTLLLVAVAPDGADAAARPEFRGSVQKLPPRIKRRMVSWHPGCPVRRRALRLLRVSYIRFDGEVRTGNLIVNRRWGWKVVSVFRQLYDGGVRIKRLRLADAYGAKDRRMMRHNVTSGFNCRFVAGTSHWSQHAYGKAIDINPVQNPYVSGSHVSPAAGRDFLDRSNHRRGMTWGSGTIVKAFESIGWKWGGRWSGAKDYMHFSATGT